LLPKLYKRSNSKKQTMKKIILLFIVSATFISCGAATAAGGQSSAEEGVVINGIRWATRNVGAPGTFVQNPQDAGMFYQWNHRTAWAAAGEIADWSNVNPSGDSWARANDPCPQGWRVPTEEEWASLTEGGGTWLTVNDVDGKLFGTAPNQIFLPAAGWRSNSNGALNGVGVRGSYWSSTQNSDTQARAVGFASGYATMSGGPRALGRPIRCVAQ
jgi:uncharacterized protein (TIGR02145 family)